MDEDYAEKQDSIYPPTMIMQGSKLKKMAEDYAITTKAIMLIIASIFLITLATAETQTLGTFQQDTCINLIQTCSNCTYVNISSVIYPNSTQALGQVAMTKNGVDYNYTFCKANVTGQYIVNGYGDVDGVVEVWTYDFDVTENGRENPEGIIKIFFIIIFLIILIGAVFSILNCIGHWASFDCDIFDAGGAMGIYLSVIALYYFSQMYMGSSFIEDILLMFIKVGWLTHIFIPMFAFASSLIWNPLRRAN